ncbi:MAG TPA: hypothetical protein VGS10_11395 [Terracidiphilus sp.]|nr:hypothetical protein [Terracidiphilus sp.]
MTAPMPLCLPAPPRIAPLSVTRDTLVSALITICTQMEQPDGSLIPHTIDTLAEAMGRSYRIAERIMHHFERLGLVQLWWARWHPTPMAYTYDLESGSL